MGLPIHLTLAPHISFPAFRPAWYAPGGHVQTILGNFLRRDRPSPILTPHVVPLGDGDGLVLHIAEPTAEAIERAERTQKRRVPKAGVLLMHGLGGTHQSAYVLRAAQKLLERGYWVAAIDHRGCGMGLNHAKHVTHAGRSGDVGTAIDYLRERFSPDKLAVVGYSLSGNMVLKWAAEAGTAYQNQVAVMAVCPPVDLPECSQWIERKRSWLYNQNFCLSLIQTVEHRRKMRPDAHHISFARWPRTLREFDSVFTAPLAGFRSVEDYYASSSSMASMEKIAVPTLILAAEDDPIVPIGPLRKAKLSPSTNLVITKGGGHLGYLTASRTDPDHRWMDWRVVDFVNHVCQTND